MQEFGELDGVCTFCELAVPLATRLAEKLGLPGNMPSAVDAARDKHATRTKLADAGLPTPKNFLITEAKHLKPAAEHVGFPSGLLANLHSNLLSPTDLQTFTLQSLKSILLKSDHAMMT